MYLGTDESRNGTERDGTTGIGTHTLWEECGSKMMVAIRIYCIVIIIINTLK